MWFRVKSTMNEEALINLDNVTYIMPKLKEKRLVIEIHYISGEIDFLPFSNEPTRKNFFEKLTKALLNIKELEK